MIPLQDTFSRASLGDLPAAEKATLGVRQLEEIEAEEAREREEAAAGRPAGRKEEAARKEGDARQQGGGQQGVDQLSHMELKPETDPFKLMMNRIDALIRSGADEDLMQAYEMTTSLAVSGRYDPRSPQYNRIADTYDGIGKILEGKPELQQILQMTSDYRPGAESPLAPRAPSPNEIAAPAPAWAQNKPGFSTPGFG